MPFRLKQFTLRGAVATLVAFHAYLLVQRVADSTLFEAAVLAKWLGATAILAGALLLRRFAPQAAGRSGIILFWLLVFFLHVPAYQIDAELLAQFTIVLALVLLGASAVVPRIRAIRPRTATVVPVPSVASRLIIPPRCPPVR
jgi:hypothetical protein